MYRIVRKSTSVCRQALVEILCLVVLVSICSCDKSKTESSSTTVSPEYGGTVSLSNGASVEIPSGAVSSEVEVRVNRTEQTTSGDGFEGVGDVYNLEPEGMVFSKAVELVLPVSADRLSEYGDDRPHALSVADSLDVFMREGEGPWKPLRGWVDVSSGTIRAQTYHFSTATPGVNCSPSVSLVNFEEDDLESDHGGDIELVFNSAGVDHVFLSYDATDMNFNIKHGLPLTISRATGASIGGVDTDVIPPAEGSRILESVSDGEHRVIWNSNMDILDGSWMVSVAIVAHGESGTAWTTTGSFFVTNEPEPPAPETCREVLWRWVYRMDGETRTILIRLPDDLLPPQVSGNSYWPTAADGGYILETCCDDDAVSPWFTGLGVSDMDRILSLNPDIENQRAPLDELGTAADPCVGTGGLVEHISQFQTRDCPFGTARPEVCDNGVDEDLDGVADDYCAPVKDAITLPGATFSMGDPQVGSNSNNPLHEVTLSPFAIDRHEVTNDEYRRCVGEGACYPPDGGGTLHDGSIPYWTDSRYGAHPMVHVSWFAARNYCEWVGGRLPTEAEWEYAARGADDTRAYPWGEEITCALANHGNSASELVPSWRVTTCASVNPGMPEAVGSREADVSPFGVRDMAGNVSEWVADGYRSDAYHSAGDTNPEVELPVDYYWQAVLRGGNASDVPENCRVDRRRNLTATWVYGSGVLGFRCAYEPGCVPNCHGKECGPDGCGGTCAPGCGAGESCNNGVCETVTTDIVWIQISGGTYQMGSTAGSPDELPIHSVTVPAFDMAKTEVTVDQYQACVDAGTCTLPDDNTSNSYCNWGYSDRGAYPVNCVDWDQAVAFCSWAGGRLPSEAEWEYAARSGGQDIAYPWGDDTATCQYAVMSEGGNGCGLDSTWAACGKTAGNTAQGLCDMAGNVWEWVQDCNHDDYTGAPTDGSAWEDTGSYRVKRGGGFGNGAVGLRAAYRYGVDPSARDDGLGFRCAR